MANTKKPKPMRTVPARHDRRLRLGDALDQVVKILTLAKKKLSHEEFRDFLEEAHAWVEEFENDFYEDPREQ